MKEIIPMHAKSHKLGGSDPLQIEVPEIFGSVLSQSVTADEELTFTSVTTNDRTTFAWDPTDPAGLLLKRTGFYLAFAWANYSAPDSTTIRSISVRGAPVSDGPFATEFAQWFLPGGGLTTSPMSVTATSEGKTNLSEISIGSFLVVDPVDPIRVAVVLDHTGTNYTVAKGTLRVMRFSGGGSTPPLPPTA